MVAHLRVHGVGEIDRRGAARQGKDLALGREHVDLVGEEVHLDVLEELHRVAGFALDLEERLQPLRGLELHVLVGTLEALVHPVRGDTRLGHLVHVLRADLDLDRHAERAEERGVQRLVAVRLRDRDVVLELARDRLVERMQRAQREVAGRHVGHDDAEAVDVEHLGERDVLLLHLLVDRGDVLLAAGHLRLHLEFLQPRADALLDLAHRVAAVAARLRERLVEHAKARGVQRMEAQVLELVVERVQPQAIGDRRVDVERLAGDALLLLRRHGIERAHVVQPVGELDEDDAHVARHREQHLAEVLRLRVLQRLELDALDLGDAVHQLGHLLAEALGDLALGGRRVLDHVVQQCRHQRLGIQVPLGEDLGDREGMRDVRLAALPVLAGVRGARDVVRFFDLRDILRLEVAEKAR
jgi:hypothetical protein